MVRIPRGVRITLPRVTHWEYQGHTINTEKLGHIISTEYLETRMSTEYFKHG